MGVENMGSGNFKTNIWTFIWAAQSNGPPLKCRLVEISVSFRAKKNKV